jgi:GxxExxY protein
MEPVNKLPEEERRRLNEISRDVIGAAIRVHTVLGPGLLENAYEACLEHELLRRGHSVKRQISLPVMFDGLKVDLGYRIDMVVDDLVILELKACETIAPVHRSQLTSYLKLSQRHLGLLINFHVYSLKDGIVRIVNSF